MLEVVMLERGGAGLLWYDFTEVDLKAYRGGVLRSIH